MHGFEVIGLFSSTCKHWKRRLQPGSLTFLNCLTMHSAGIKSRRRIKKKKGDREEEREREERRRREREGGREGERRRQRKRLITIK